MKVTDARAELSQFLPQKNLILMRGYLMVGVGVLIALGSIVAPNVGMMSFKNAWLPVAAIVIMTAGAIEGYDAYISRRTNRFFSNLQFAILDSTVGWMIFLSLNYPATQIAILIAAFLIIKGLFRLIGAYAGHFANGKPAMIGGAISCILGLIIWAQWPGEFSSGFLSFFLSVEIALRGWALIKFADWLSELEE
jgi:uncharacterized membrane protein HdeD (DUF308 family)